MSTRSLGLSPALYDYLLAVSLREPELLSELRRETAALPNAGMQISPEQGQFMRLLIELTGARRALEVGVFTGYSSLCVALALPADGELVACDVSPTYTDIARKYWQRAGVEQRVSLRIAPAVTTLDGLLESGQKESFDFAFIDADKENYSKYYEQALALLKPGGLLTIDNVLWSGNVADLSDTSPSTEAIRRLNATVKNDQRVTISLLPVGDGLFLVRKR